SGGCGLLGERSTAAATEFFSWLIHEATGRAGKGQRHPTLGTEPAPCTIFRLATGTLHVRASWLHRGGTRGETMRPLNNNLHLGCQEPYGILAYRSGCLHRGQ